MNWNGRKSDNDIAEKYESLGELNKSKARALSKNLASELGSKFVLSKPESIKDIERIIDNIKERQSVLADLSGIREETAQRMLDFLSGAIYAVDGTMQYIKDNMYIFIPSGVSVTGLSINKKR